MSSPTSLNVDDIRTLLTEAHSKVLEQLETVERARDEQVVRIQNWQQDHRESTQRLKTERDNLDGANTSLIKQVTGLQAKLKKLHENVADVEKRNAELLERVAALESDKARLEEKVKDLETQQQHSESSTSINGTARSQEFATAVEDAIMGNAATTDADRQIAKATGHDDQYACSKTLKLITLLTLPQTSICGSRSALATRAVSDSTNHFSSSAIPCTNATSGQPR